MKPEGKSRESLLRRASEIRANAKAVLREVPNLTFDEEKEVGRQFDEATELEQLAEKMKD